MPATSQRAEGLERESWTAWWRDDGDAAIAAREAAFAAYRERGDALGAARMATWLAADELDFRGAAPVAVEAEMPEARVIQHELDHLDGVLTLDRTSKDQRRAALRELRNRR